MSVDYQSRLFKFEFNGKLVEFTLSQISTDFPPVGNSKMTKIMYMIIAADIYKYDIDDIKQFIKANKDEINEQVDGHTSLMFACMCSKNKYAKITAELLIEEGANLDIRGEDNDTALSLACFGVLVCSDVQIIEKLINAGAKLNVEKILIEMVFNMKYNAINNVTSNKFENVVKLLLDKAPNLDFILDKNLQVNFSLLEYVYMCNNEKFVGKELTLLEFICLSKNKEIIKYCLEKYSFTEEQLKNCIKITNFVNLFSPYLSKLYTQKLNYVPLSI